MRLAGAWGLKMPRSVELNFAKVISKSSPPANLLLELKLAESILMNMVLPRTQKDFVSRNEFSLQPTRSKQR
jgi:hypothetical protein